MASAQKILVTTDDQTFGDLIEIFLIESGYKSVTLIPGKRAYDVALEVQPDMLLLDIDIAQPRTGWSTLDHVKLDPRTTHIPILICTTDMKLVRDKQDWLASKGCRCLEKPFDLQDLLGAMERLIGPRRTS